MNLTEALAQLFGKRTSKPQSGLSITKDDIYRDITSEIRIGGEISSSVLEELQHFIKLYPELPMTTAQNEEEIIRIFAEIWIDPYFNRKAAQLFITNLRRKASN